MTGVDPAPMEEDYCMSSRVTLVWRAGAEPEIGIRRLRWPSSSEEVREQRHVFERMWEEIAQGKRPCICRISYDRPRVQGRPAGAGGTSRAQK